mmetsp:Transcript_118092/g.381144  ORF Transcript_118092/g.381144 Transcript_118092/m.381144 type:complete len:269 (+) Transcript_118092:116-922(+)
MALAFVPMAQGPAVAPPPALLRGSVDPAPPAPAGASAFTPPALAMLTCGAYAAGRRGRKLSGTARRFFGGAAAPPPKPKSYKDLDDPWLGSADLGFDPLNVSVSSGVFDGGATASPATVYYNYRESEVKHGRFAMAAFLAIFAEAADRSALFHQLGFVGAEDRLDGTLGLDEVQAPVLIVGLGYQALAEYNLQRDEADGDFTSVEYKKDRCPGDLGFDPLGLGRGKGSDFVGLHNIEVNSGRLAMIGITSFLFREFVAKDPALASKIL